MATAVLAAMAASPNPADIVLSDDSGVQSGVDDPADTSDTGSSHIGDADTYEDAILAAKGAIWTVGLETLFDLGDESDRMPQLLPYSEIEGLVGEKYVEIQTVLDMYESELGPQISCDLWSALAQYDEQQAALEEKEDIEDTFQLPDPVEECEESSDSLDTEAGDADAVDTGGSPNALSQEELNRLVNGLTTEYSEEISQEQAMDAALRRLGLGE